MPDDFEELAGVGAKAAEALREAGYLDFMSVAAASASNISEACVIGQKTAEKIILEARKKMRMGFESADKVLKKRDKVGRISTGSTSLDELLGGGVQTQSITEVHGQFGSAKTQIAFQLSVNVQLPKDKGGLDAKCVYIDTEGSFRPERIKDMAEAKDMDPLKALKNVFVGRAFNSDHQILLTEEAKELVSEKNVKLIIVDSLTAMFRTDYMGRGELAPRQQRLNRHIHTLQKLADANNAAVFVTNQVMARPDMLFGDPTTAIGGNIVGHGTKYRLYLRRSRKDSRIARLIDSPDLPTGEAIFLVKKEGIVDEGTRDKKKKK